jgi:hypothetical protein
MFKRRWIWFGDLVSDDGFALHYGNRSVTYTDQRGLSPGFPRVGGSA